MKKFRGFFLILVFLLTACTQDTVVPKEKEEEKNNENIVVTPDGKITFEIVNNIEVPQEKVESIKDEILTAYDDIQDSIHTDYVPSERINVYLNEGDNVSWGLRSKIILYGIREDRYHLVHELTHSLLGYGNNFEKSSGYGYFTQEGFATYMEDKYGKINSYSHQFVKSFIDTNKLIPIHNLIDPNQEDSYFRPDLTSQTGDTLMWMSYMHSASFVKYLIDTYGLEKFEKIYNKKNVAKKIEEVYGKNISEIENDWIGFIKNSQEPTNKEKIKMMNYSYLSSSLIDQIDPKYFTKE
ncbi:peptidase MA family metallohydrolase [Lysinibacillus xylanilyticus]|uniref:peptidase MA family metallohydrolase n=1 Tax=Lysinibacillus xylanilyticus TaxID=582475 RepID=UPI003D07F750